MISYEGKNRHTVNYLKAMVFDYPEWTPCRVSLMPATWIKYREELEEVVLAHPRIFPDYEKEPAVGPATAVEPRAAVEFTARGFDRLDNPLYQAGRRTDCWGTVWENIEPGLDSHPVGFPLGDWSALDSYVPPDPLKDDLFDPRDWEQVRQTLDDARRKGDLVGGGPLWHGFMYMRLFYLRGFQNLMTDMATDDPRLQQVIQMVEDYNAVVIRKYLSLGAEYVSFGDDLGLQTSLPMSPAMWQKYIKPSYERLFRLCREADVPIYLHTDGHILEIIPDLIEVGVTVLNPQIRANGLEGLVELAKGKVAIDQDLDRQLFPFATPSQIEDHINEVFEGLYLPEGGLMLFAECEPDVPLENIHAICTVLEEVCNPPEP